jgi:hypothetical protein
MVKGTDANKLFTDQVTRNITIEYKGEEWDFTVRDLGWKEKGDCITAGTKVNITGKKANAKKTITMDMPSYNIAYLMKAIVKAPFSVNVASFMKLDNEFGDLLVEAVINPEGDDEEGNSEEQSEE